MNGFDLSRIGRLEAALASVLVGGNHLALLIGADHPPYTATDDEAHEHYCCVLRQPDLYETWLCWRSIMRARDVLRESAGRPVPDHASGPSKIADFGNGEVGTR